MSPWAALRLVWYLRSENFLVLVSVSVYLSLSPFSCVHPLHPELCVSTSLSFVSPVPSPARGMGAKISQDPQFKVKSTWQLPFPTTS